VYTHAERFYRTADKLVFSALCADVLLIDACAILFCSRKPYYLGFVVRGKLGA
jgi:hypothetical protein